MTNNSVPTRLLTYPSHTIEVILIDHLDFPMHPIPSSPRAHNWRCIHIVTPTLCQIITSHIKEIPFHNGLIGQAQKQCRELRAESFIYATEGFGIYVVVFNASTCFSHLRFYYTLY